ncbi:MAG: hypothetical protein GY898_06180 [Proteobacteria bacterium]|nr:hypothetical protein [Pseudomonadota bacterium]
MGGNGRWLDVCLRNVELLLAGCEDLGIDPQPIIDALPEHVAADPKSLRKAWVSLDDFNLVFDAFVAAAGHPAHLRKASHALPRVEFSSEVFSRLMLKSWIRWVTTPAVALKPFTAATRKWTTNKLATLLYPVSRPGGNTIRIDYLRGPGGESPRAAKDDLLSVLYWIPGLAEQLAPQWPGQPNPGPVRILRVEADILTVAHGVLPGSRAELSDGVFTIDGAALGRVVWLLPDEELQDEYMGRFENLPPEDPGPVGAIPAVASNAPSARFARGRGSRWSSSRRARSSVIPTIPCPARSTNTAGVRSGSSDG